MYVHTRERYILAELYLLIYLPICMYVHTRERPGFDGVKIKCYYYYYYLIIKVNK